MDEQYVGSRKIAVLNLSEDEKITSVSFEEAEGEVSTPIEVNTDLLNAVISNEKGDGGLTDAIRHYLATKFLQVMAEYDLEVEMVRQVAMGMDNLSQNNLESAVAKKFGVSTQFNIKLKDLV